MRNEYGGEYSSGSGLRRWAKEWPWRGALQTHELRACMCWCQGEPSLLSAVVEEVQSLGGDAALGCRCDQNRTSSDCLKRLALSARLVSSTTRVIISLARSSIWMWTTLSRHGESAALRFFVGREATCSMMASGGTLIFTGASLTARAS